MKGQLKLWVLAIGTSQLLGTSPVVAEGSTDVVPSTNIVSRNKQVQVFSGPFTVTADQAGQPLTLTVTNGSFSGLKFAWVRVFLVNTKLPSTPAQPSGHMLLTEQSFRNSDTATVNLAGMLRAGGNTLLFQGAGMPGAGLTYEITGGGGGGGAAGKGASGKGAAGGAKSKGVQISSIDPKDVNGGGIITIKGTGFDDDFAAHNLVTIANQKVDVQSVKETEIAVKVPDRLPQHEQQVQVTVNGVKSNIATFNIVGPPDVSGCSPAVMQPGATAEITGNNFSTEASKNVVTLTFYNPEIKKTLQVVSAKKNSLTVNIPEFPEMVNNSSKASGAPAKITVTVNGVESKSYAEANVRATSQ